MSGRATRYNTTGHGSSGEYTARTTTTTPGAFPTNKDECKRSGWQGFGFRNQGQCVSFVNHVSDSGRPSRVPLSAKLVRYAREHPAREARWCSGSWPGRRCSPTGDCAPRVAVADEELTARTDERQLKAPSVRPGRTHPARHVALGVTRETTSRVIRRHVPTCLASGSSPGGPTTLDGH
jgi:hypothetical protein